MIMRAFCLAFLLLQALYSAQADSPCQSQTDVCKCVTKNGTLDLSLAFQGDKAHVNLTDPGGEGNTVVISPCQDYDCGGTLSRGCQWDASGDVYYVLGKGQTVEWAVKSMTDFIVTFQGGAQTFDGRDRYAQVHATTGAYAVAYAGESGDAPAPIIYSFSASVQSFAPGGGGGGGSEAPVGIAGLVIMIILLVALGAYFVIGAIVMYTVKGARGKEIVPNYGFWTAVPFLIKDGFVFTFSPCVNKIRERKGYSSL